MGKFLYRVTFTKGPAWYLTGNSPAEARAKAVKMGAKPKTIKAVEKDQTL